MTTEKLKEILEKHKKWLNNEEGGERANLCNADLCNADLRDANLRDANLRDADLHNADLSNADLRAANLSDANLREADLREADLHNADLRCANLRGADLCDANLRCADLRGADLCGADLRAADLDYSVLPLWCGSLKAHFDDKQIIQFIYHVTKAGLYSKNVSPKIKEELKKLTPIANKFHRSDECGKFKSNDYD